MSLRLQLLEEQLEAVEAGLAHPEQRVRAADLTEVWSPVAAAGAEDIDLAEHVLDHEVLALQGQTEGESGRGGESETEIKREGRCDCLSVIHQREKQNTQKEKLKKET